MRQEGYEYAERCANCGSDDIGSYWSGSEGHLCPKCATEYESEKAARKVSWPAASQKGKEGK